MKSYLKKAFNVKLFQWDYGKQAQERAIHKNKQYNEERYNRLIIYQ